MYMYFVNENLRAVTQNDTKLLYEVCIMLRTLCFIGGRKTKFNPKWSLVQLECHSIARLTSLIFKELRLIDGILLGLGLSEEKDKITVQYTYHSWLITPDGAIIDPYPMGLISTNSAVLIPTNNTRYSIHAGNLYREDSGVKNHFNVEQSWEKARSCIRTLRKHAKDEDMKKIIKSLI